MVGLYVNDLQPKLAGRIEFAQNAKDLEFNWQKKKQFKIELTQL